jgi:hypothetical protein
MNQNHYTNEQATARGEIMKGLLIGLLTLGSISAFAQVEFDYPAFKGDMIAASSNKDAVCKLLTGSATAESLTYTKDGVAGGRYGIVVVKNNRMRVKTMQVYQGSEKIVSYIMCAE